MVTLTFATIWSHIFEGNLAKKDLRYRTPKQRPKGHLKYGGFPRFGEGRGTVKKNCFGEAQ